MIKHETGNGGEMRRNANRHHALGFGLADLDPTRSGSSKFFEAVQANHERFSSQLVGSAQRRAWARFLDDWMWRSWKAVFGRH